ncbi:hypothetical protein H0H93_010858 [Arthromyces matolae]|nr:hypothetical protein H0H93_010858 [Arthromyces matolae]
MQWDATVHGGFTSGTPWMRVNDDYETSNVDVQSTNENSVLNFWKKALKVRKDHEVLIYGNFVDLDPEHEQVLVYTRTLGEVTALVVLNFKETEITYSLGSHGARTWKEDAKYVIGNYPPGPPGAGDVALNGDVIVLRGFEGRLYI